MPDIGGLPRKDSGKQTAENECADDQPEQSLRDFFRFQPIGFYNYVAAEIDRRESAKEKREYLTDFARAVVSARARAAEGHGNVTGMAIVGPDGRVKKVTFLRFEITEAQLSAVRAGHIKQVITGVFRYSAPGDSTADYSTGFMYAYETGVDQLIVQGGQKDNYMR